MEKLSLDKITAPFTDEQVESLNKYQQSGMFHPFTCCSPEEIKECTRTSGESEGILIATNEGWICPCGKYKQDWAHSFMTEFKEQSPLSEEEKETYKRLKNIWD